MNNKTETEVPLKQRAINYFYEREKEFARIVYKWQNEKYFGSRLIIPFLFEGVVDSVRWNNQKKRFDKIFLTVNDSDNYESDLIFSRSVLTDKAKKIEIDIPVEEKKIEDDRE